MNCLAPRSLLAALLALAACTWALPALAQAEGDELDLEALFNTSQVGVATKREQSTQEAPAVVDVITREEIAERGYMSVAEALRTVPGFYVVDDHLLPNVGVRGLSSGQRSWSRIMKVMIDGQPVPYRPDGSNWLGPELIPIELVRRIEIIRGPASALYGADAFLGVVNVVSRSGQDVDGFGLASDVGARATYYQGRSGLTVGGASDTWGVEAVLAGAAGIGDRSGLRVPTTSPQAGTYAPMASLNDLSTPASAFARMGWKGPWGLQLGLDGAYQRLNAGGEFQDWRPMTHQNRIAADNRFVRAQLRKPFDDTLTLSSSVAYSLGGPTPDDRLSIGREDYYIQRQMQAQGWDLATDLTWSPDDRNALTLGADFTHQNQLLPTFYNVFTAASPRAGEIQQAGAPGAAVLLNNWGGFLQGTYYPLERLGVTANLRDDYHNVYGNNFSSRLGLVYLMADGLVAKALYGSSFKAPSVPQLYGTPLIYGDILGNKDLKPERANTIEGVLSYAPSRALDLTGSVYYTHVDDKVSFFTRSGNPFAVNLGQLDSAGVEAAMKWRWRFLHGLFNTSLQKTVPTLANGFPDPDGVPEPYPAWMVNAGLGSPLGPLPVKAYGEARYVGWVPASQANFAANGHEPYSIAPAFVTDLTFSNADRYLFGERETWLTFKVSNLFDTLYVQPGYGGVDYPGLGRTFSLRFRQAF